MLSVVQLSTEDAHRNGGEAVRSTHINHMAEVKLVTELKLVTLKLVFSVL